MHSRGRKLEQIQHFTHDGKNRTRLVLTSVIVVVIVPPSHPRSVEHTHTVSAIISFSNCSCIPIIPFSSYSCFHSNIQPFFPSCYHAGGLRKTLIAWCRKSKALWHRSSKGKVALCVFARTCAYNILSWTLSKQPPCFGSWRRISMPLWLTSGFIISRPV